MKLTLGLAQINTCLGNPEKNLAKHQEFADKALARGVELLVFPELSLTGYVLQDLVPAVACRASADDPILAELLKTSRKLDLVVGFPEEDERNRFFISAAYLSQGRIVHVHRKVYLPTYGMFDEGRFFAWGNSVQAFDTRFGRMGMLICEDFWHASPPYLLWLDGADLFLFTSASPGRGISADAKLGTSRWVESINQAYAGLYTSFMVHANRVGYEDGLHFWGGSTIFNPDGELVCQAPYHEEGLTVSTLDLNQLHRTRARLPLLRDERTALVQHELNRILSQPRNNTGR
jgi:NAD+ synthase (glutamine-hydrolysing)